MVKIIKLALAVLFLLCLADIPYGFYQFVRFLALIGFGILAWEAGQRNHSPEMLMYVALAILFQPIFKISLGRYIWNMVDVVVGVGLMVSLLKSERQKYCTTRGDGKKT